MNCEQIKQARLLLNLSQVDFADRLGWTSCRNVTKIETGDKPVTTQTAMAVQFMLIEAGKLSEYHQLIESEK